MKRNILVFPCGSEIGLEIYRSLAFSTHFTIFGASSTDDHGRFVYNNYIDGIPYAEDKKFLKKLNEVIDTHKIDIVIPAHDDVVLRLARAKSSGELNCDVLTSPLETCEIARSKNQTYEALSGIVPVPERYASASEINFPVFLKPDVGQGSKGTYKAKTVEEVQFYLQQDPSLLKLEYLPGKEFTVDCFTNRNRKLLFCEGRQRSRISGGISVNSTSIQDARFQEIADRINDSLVFRGAWFFQVKENSSGELVLMEIAPRIAGTMGLARCRGVNLVLLSLFDWLGMEVEISVNDYQMTIDRALSNRYRHNISYSHVYLDFDDLVIINGKVNPIVMAFVYQCMNKKVQIHLITKHKKDLETSLKEYRLSNVFDEIIWIQDNREKPEHIKEKDAIFIDDSFAERKRVYDSCKIPVFDSHMLEGLMEKF